MEQPGARAAGVGVTRLEEVVFGGMFYAGCGCLVVAAWMVATPLGLAVLGVALVAGAVLAVDRRAV